MRVLLIDDHALVRKGIEELLQSRGVQVVASVSSGEAPLEYQYALIGARRMPNVNPQNAKFSAASNAWRRLPLAAANLAGPFLARHLA